MKYLIFLVFLIGYAHGQEVYTLSRYYVPEPKQSYYFNKSYTKEVRVQFGNDKNILITADGTKLQHSDRMQIVSCPGTFPLGTKLRLEPAEWSGSAITVTCRDRGGAIKGRRLDMFCGIGNKAIQQRKGCITGKRKVSVVKTPQNKNGDGAEP